MMFLILILIIIINNNECNLQLLLNVSATTTESTNKTTIAEEEKPFVVGVDDDDTLDYDNEGDKKWIKNAVQNVAYYLRAHKFNDFDRRYYKKKPTSDTYIHLYGKFPQPPLKFFHWEVFKNCNENFLSCLRYLYETSVDAFLQQSIDSAVIIRRRNWTVEHNLKQMQIVDDTCKKIYELDWKRAEPFKGPLERFQWRTTASYYMCWYTMKETPELRHLEGYCDNFANCTAMNYTTSNYDIRANDSIPFQCATYSFCPDLCCPKIQQLSKNEECLMSSFNPCTGKKDNTCSMNATLNRDLLSLIYNEWNLTCVCDEHGYVWRSRFGMCVDVNECQVEENPCDSQLCLNLPGKYECGCEFGYKWEEKEKACKESDVLENAVKRFDGFDVPEEEEEGKSTAHILKQSTGFLIFMLINYFFIINF